MSEKEKKKNLIWRIICILTSVVFIPIILFNLTLTIHGAINQDSLPSIFGFSPTVVGSGSMAPEFEENDLIFIIEVNTDELNQEDIICFRDKDGDFVTHRISRIEVVNGEKHFYTSGDFTGSEDPDYILSNQIQGKYIGKIAKVGGVVLFLQSPYGLILMINLLILLYISGELLFDIRDKKFENKTLIDENEKLKLLLNSNTPENINTSLINKPRYNRSFFARLIQKGKKTQTLYTLLKNYLMQFEQMKSKMNWDNETYSCKSGQILKLIIKGKSLYAYLALTPEEIETLSVDEIVNINKYSSTPAKIKVTGIVKLNKVKKAIDLICKRFSLTNTEMPSNEYYYPYETDKELMQQGLIKKKEQKVKI